MKVLILHDSPFGTGMSVALQTLTRGGNSVTAYGNRSVTNDVDLVISIGYNTLPPRIKPKLVLIEPDYSLCHRRTAEFCTRCKSCDHDRIEDYKRIAEMASLRFALSPLHQKRLKWLFGVEFEEVLVPPIDVDLVGRGTTREGTLAVCGTSEYKGWKNIAEYAILHRDTSITVYGNNFTTHTDIPSNIVVNGPVDHATMIREYCKYSDFVHFPLWVEPCGYGVLEAYLAGCNIQVSNSGVQSFPWFTTDKKERNKVAEILRNGPAEFWKKVKS